MQLKFLILTAAVLLAPLVASFAQPIRAIPKTATILEERLVGSKRKLVIWMPNPTKHPSGLGRDDIYTCPDHTRGSYYSGELKVTLLNTATNRLINTLDVKGYEVEGSLTTVDIPYLIRAGYYYTVPNGSAKVERKPRIIDLKDYNGDGNAHEFRLLDAEACMGLGTTLIGYSKPRDRVVQYPVETTTPEGASTNYWLDYLFAEKPIAKGQWKYEIDYRGRGGTLDRFRVRYDRKHEKFIAVITRQE